MLPVPSDPVHEVGYEGDFFRKVSVSEYLLVPGDPVHEGGLCSAGDFFRNVSVSESPFPAGLVLAGGLCR